MTAGPGIRRRPGRPGPARPGTRALRRGRLDRRSLDRALAAANQLGDAITVLDEAAGDYERVRGPGHVDTLDAREDLAAAYQAAGDLAAAIELAQRTLADRERIQGPGHPDTAATRRRLDELRGRQGAAGRPPGLMGSVRGMLSRGSGRARG